MSEKDMWPMPTVLAASAGRSKLDDQVQAVISGELSGPAATEVLRAALEQYYRDDMIREARRVMIERAERALVYGPGIGRRPTPDIGVRYLGVTLT